MSFNPEYATAEPARADVDGLAGPTLLEFGSPWCGHCRRATSLVEQAFATHPGVRHIRIEDGSGRPLGRSFGVKLWPTMIFLKDGREICRLIRPQHSGEVVAAMTAIDQSGTA